MNEHYVTDDTLECHTFVVTHDEADARGKAGMLRKLLPRGEGWRVRCVSRTVTAFHASRVVWVVLAVRDRQSAA